MSFFIGDRIELVNGVESEVVDEVEVDGDGVNLLAVLNEVHVGERVVVEVE